MQIPAKKLGFGFMRLPLTDAADQKAIDFAQLEKMTDLFFARGFTYLDTAWMYHDFMSEPAIARAVVERYPREAFTVATKMPTMMLKREGQAEEIFAQQQDKLQTKFFDYYLVHDMNSVNYKIAKKFHVLEFLQERRQSGEIRCLGFSFHDSAAVLDEILTENPYFEFVQLQINYLDWESAGIQAHQCYDVCVKHGKKVVVMEPIKGGTLAKVPPEVEKLLRQAHADWSPAEWAIRFAASLPEVMVVLSGMSTMAQLSENTQFMEDFQPLAEKDWQLLLHAAEMIRQTIAIPCTGCRYCIEASKCPMNLLIPNYFALFNTRKLMQRHDFSPEMEYYANFLHAGYGKASACISCHACERVCPQHIHISEWMPKVAADLEQDSFMK